MGCTGGEGGVSNRLGFLLESSCFHDNGVYVGSLLH